MSSLSAGPPAGNLEYTTKQDVCGKWLANQWLQPTAAASDHEPPRLNHRR